VTSDLNNSGLLGFANKGFFETRVATLDSEDNINSASELLIGNFRGIVTICALNEIPEHLSSLVSEHDIVIKTSVLVHIGTV
jgi:hypothetical protein